MGYPTRIQQIRRKKSSQWYVNVPAALANAMEFQKGEVVEWVIKKNSGLLLVRRSAGEKKTLPRGRRATAINYKSQRGKERPHRKEKE
jgi:antitoxin component of MazEF toxin-antitoxin module